MFCVKILCLVISNALKPFPYFHAATSRSSCPIPGKESARGKGKMTKFSNFQLSMLRKRFEEAPYIQNEESKQFSEITGLSEACIGRWFNNERMRRKRIRMGTTKGMV